jgi:arylsulfatase A-like enzyme
MKTITKNVILPLLPLVISGSANAQAQETEKPNVLFIAIDDLNDWAGAFGGNPQTITPNIDRLAEESVVFQNANCPGPVSGPSRSALLSGFMPHTSGIYSNSQNMLHSEIIQNHATLPEYFSKNGYLTISKGKIFHKHKTKQGVDHGQWAFDIWERERGGGGVQKDKYFDRNKGIINGVKQDNPKFTGGGGSGFRFGPTEGPKEVTKDYRTAEWFAEKLNQHYSRPFFMAVGISKPHLPFIVPEEYFDMYDLDTIKIPEHREDDLEDIVDKQGRQVFHPKEDYKWVKQDEELFKHTVRAYMAASSYADVCAGVILDALKKSNYADNTIVVLFGDHGWHLGEKLRFRKATLWKEATQLPLMIHRPGMDQQQYCHRTVNLIDLYPTLVDLCNLPDKPELDGESIVPLLDDPSGKWHPTVTDRSEGSHSVISEDWHYVIHGNGAEELYHLEEDPYEWNNLIRSDSEEAQEAAEYLRTFLPENSKEYVPDYDKDKSNRSTNYEAGANRCLDELK